MEKKPKGYTGENSSLDEDGEWTFENGEWIAHQRNDNNRYKWYYSSEEGTFGERVVY